MKNLVICIVCLLIFGLSSRSFAQSCVPQSTQKLPYSRKHLPGKVTLQQLPGLLKGGRNYPAEKFEPESEIEKEHTSFSIDAAYKITIITEVEQKGRRSVKSKFTWQLQSNGKLKKV